MLLAAERLGYRSCWYEGHITDVDKIGDQMAKILDVSEGYELVCISDYILRLLYLYAVLSKAKYTILVFAQRQAMENVP